MPTLTWDDEVNAALTPVLAALDALDIRYYIGGSLASSLWGEARSTNDADIVAALRPEHVDPLYALLRPQYYVDQDTMRDAVRRHDCFNLIDPARFYKIDIFRVQALDPFEVSALARAVPFENTATGGVILFPTPEDVILQKLRWWRKGGNRGPEVVAEADRSQRQWHDVRGVAKAQAADLDWAYLREYAQGLELTADLARLEREVTPPPPEAP